MNGRRALVIGPAYLDRVLRVDGPLVPAGRGGPLDQSVEGEGKFGDGDSIAVVAPGGYELEIRPPPDWPGPRGQVRLTNPIREGLSGRRSVRGTSWLEDLGGMGAGYAAAFGGELHSALGPEDEPTSRTITDRLARYGVAHRPLRVPGRGADWTLLVTSGEYGDKLPIGFRGCHAALEPAELARRAGTPADLLVVAALPNRLVEAVLRAAAAPTRFLAPAMRNVTDRAHPLARFADCIDILCCNRTEWEALGNGEAVAAVIPVVAVTDGSRGFEVRFTDPHGEVRRLRRDAFPRLRPPRDTNRAGEAFASAFVATLLDEGWTGARRVIGDGPIRAAADRAAAAAALVLDRLEFGFPRPEEVQTALRIGRVP